MHTLDAWLTGLSLVFEWPAIGFLFLGIFIGIWFGAIPGLGGVLGLVILLPFTFGMDAVPAFALLLGLYAVTTTSDTIPSVMLGVPGTVASQATILDGYPLAQRGHAARALGAAFSVSAFGGVFGAVVLAFSLPLLLPFIREVNSPEILTFGVVGLTMVGSLSGGSIMKGLTVAALGLLFSTVGYAGIDATERFSFGTLYLAEGLPLVPVVLGLFALPELAELAVRRYSIASAPEKIAGDGGLLQGILEAVTHHWLVLRSSLVGTLVGLLPGIGAAVVDWIAYGFAVQCAKDKSQFGRGDIRGVIAPEAANNAMKGGSLIPVVAFGIPGSVGTAILMGALITQGLRPGVEMLTTNLHVTFTMVWSIVLANIVVAALLIGLSKYIARLAYLPGHLLVPAAILFVFMGAWLANVSFGDWVTCFSMGVIGVVMKRSGWPRPPLVLAFVLGGLMENRFHLSMQAYSVAEFFARPVVIAALIVIALTLYGAFRWGLRYRTTHHEVVSYGEDQGQNRVLSLSFDLLLLTLFMWAGYISLEWSSEARQFPLVVALIGTVLSTAVFWNDGAELRARLRCTKPIRGTVVGIACRKKDTEGTVAFFGYLLSMMVVAPLVGQKLALMLFIYTYLRRWGSYSMTTALCYTAVGWLVLVVLYDRLMHVFWYPSIMSHLLISLLPDWIPLWLAF